jgi:hypothetical protein
MNNRNTVYVFLALIMASWIIEFGVGWKVMEWWFNTAWYNYSYPGSQPLAEFIASLGHHTTYNPNGTVRRVVDLHWTPLSVTLFFFSLFVGIHVILAVWNGLLHPFFQRWNQGVRHPIAREREQFEAAFAAISRGYQQITRPRQWLVHDGSGLDMRWHGYILIIDRELLKHRYFAPLLAVQLGHANSEDRLAHRLYEMLPPTAGVVAILVGWPFALGHVLTFPFWMWYWKERIYAADAFAVQHGQGPALIRALDQIYLRADMATRGGRLLKPVPYIAQRIDRIQRLLDQNQTGAPQGQRVI